MGELLLSLPFSTAKVERFFSTLKIIKNERRTNLNISTLNDLLEVNTEGPTLSNFSADAAVDLWWSDCSSGRRINQKPRKEYRRNQERCSTVASDFESENKLDLDSWDNWFHTDSSSFLMITTLYFVVMFMCMTLYINLVYVVLHCKEINLSGQTFCGGRSI